MMSFTTYMPTLPKQGQDRSPWGCARCDYWLLVDAMGTSIKRGQGGGYCCVQKVHYLPIPVAAPVSKEYAI